MLSRHVCSFLISGVRSEICRSVLVVESSVDCTDDILCIGRVSEIRSAIAANFSRSTSSVKTAKIWVVSVSSLWIQSCLRTASDILCAPRRVCILRRTCDGLLLPNVTSVNSSLSFFSSEQPVRLNMASFKISYGLSVGGRRRMSETSEATSAGIFSKT